jgi:hypothetical protein
MSGAKLQRAMRLVRVTGVAVVLACALAAGSNDVGALETCKDYTMERCLPESECFEQTDEACGYEHWNPECHGAGYTACGYESCDGQEATLVCLFEPT